MENPRHEKIMYSSQIEGDKTQKRGIDHCQQGGENFRHRFDPFRVKIRSYEQTNQSSCQIKNRSR